MDRADHTTRRSFGGAARNYNFYGGLIFLSQVFPKRSAHVNFREGDIDDLEQKCLAEIVLVLRSLLL